ncbi:MAG: hypothetical protein R3D98_14600 [Candidatus Krumholzibacteriia bacterium]
MVQLLTSSAERVAQERQLLGRLLGMYTEQRELYRQVLDLSRQQRDLVRDGAPLGEVRTILERKKHCLETVRRLELTEQTSKETWRRGRPGWSAASRAQLHRTLADLGQLIEDILACEEENDRELLQQCP